MSDLARVVEFLKAKCLCHAGSNLNFALESMPASIKQPKVKLGCDCKHGQEKQIKQALSKFKTFMETKGQFKIGDRVELAVTPFIDEQTAWGWLGSKHFLVEGAKATVKEISYYSNSFRYYLIFDNESWKDLDNVVHPYHDDKKHHYCFKADDLRIVGSFSSREFLRRLWNDFYKIGD